LSHIQGSRPSRLYGRVRRPARSFAAGYTHIGEQAQFYAQTIRSVGAAFVNYRVEVIRLIAQMSLGTGALVMIGGTVAVVAFLMLAAGALVGEEGYSTLEGVGVEALTGFVAAFVNVRLAAPAIAGVALAATIGAGATAQLGAMRINEEIDALEVIGVRSIAYLASSRLIAGILVVIPLFCVALVMSMLATRGVVAVYGQSAGVYNHYFETFLDPSDVAWSLAMVVATGTLIMLVHTYYGYTATGGPAGVGEAVGRAVRTSLIIVVVVNLFLSLAIYGPHGNFHLSD
jgi:phospholipid/cholesterol/gamma-HCH transport system permease protein